MRRGRVARCTALLGTCLALARPTAAAERLELPDLRLVDQAGQDVSLRREVIGQRVVALQFVFTSCTTVCPAMGAQFSRVQALLGEGPFRLVSVSIDPGHDTPERLAAWGRRFGAGPNWRLLTGAKEDVDRLQKACGVFAADVASHSPTVVIVDGASGRFTRVSGLAAPRAVAEALARMAAPGSREAAR